MDGNIGAHARRELLEALRSRYRDSSKKGKTRILDEFVAVSGYHRKHAIRLLGDRNAGAGLAHSASSGDARCGRRTYDEAVREALVLTWEAADRICGKRLEAILPELVDALERHGHLDLDSRVRERLLAASAATIDRLLAPIRRRAREILRRRRRSGACPTVSDRSCPSCPDCGGRGKCGRHIAAKALRAYPKTPAARNVIAAQAR